MMKHFVLMRFDSGYLNDALFEEICRDFGSLQPALPEQIRSIAVHRNCVERDTNMELMVEFDLASPEALNVYLKHPIHLSLMERLIPHITSRCSFDYILS